MNPYIGHPSQIYGVEEKRHIGGKADGMRMLDVRNGLGLEFSVSVDRCADIPKMYFKGHSLSYISPCGMVGPQYYDNEGTNFLKSFTAGFITTCGLTAAGSPCVDDGEVLPLHGNISHVPAEQILYSVEDDYIIIKAIIRDASLFSHQLLLKREYRCSLKSNTLILTDTIENIGHSVSPFMILYHCNMGYPLLSEKACLDIPSVNVRPRDEHAAEGINIWNKFFPPSNDFVEQCYYHEFNTNPEISLYNPEIKTGIKMSFDISELDCFTQWKMLGKHEYVLGLEPGNCYPDGRDIMRKTGKLKSLNPGEKHTNHIQFEFYNSVEE